MKILTLLITLPFFLSSHAVLAERVDGTLVNEYREENLIYNEQLFLSAAERAQDIATGESDWSHDGWKEVIDKHYEYTVIGENLARDFQSEQEVVEAWARSKTHYDVMTLESACEYGLARFDNIYVLHVGC